MATLTLRAPMPEWRRRVAARSMGRVDRKLEYRFSVRRSNGAKRVWVVHCGRVLPGEFNSYSPWPQVVAGVWEALAAELDHGGVCPNG